MVYGDVDAGSGGGESLLETIILVNLGRVFTEGAVAEIDDFGFDPFRESVPLSSAGFRPGEYLGSRDVSRRFSKCVSTLERRGVWSAIDGE